MTHELPMPEYVDDHTCKLSYGRGDVKLWVRRNGLVRDMVPGSWDDVVYELIWTPLPENTELFTYDEANLALAEVSRAWDKVRQRILF